jgi:hypothetical protein
VLALGVAAFVLSLLAGLFTWPHLFGPKPQHSGAGSGALTVAEIRIRLAYEAGQRSVSTGRHQLVTHQL